MDGPTFLWARVEVQKAAKPSLPAREFNRMAAAVTHHPRRKRAIKGGRAKSAGMQKSAEQVLPLLENFWVKFSSRRLGVTLTVPCQKSG